MKSTLKFIFVILILCIIFSEKFVQAKVYEYTDDKGRLWHVGEQADIPLKYRNQPRQVSSYDSSHSKGGDLGMELEDREQHIEQHPFGYDGAPAKADGFQLDGRGRLDGLLESAMNVALDQSGFSEKDFLGIKIIGDDFFILWIEKALNILMNRAPMELQKIRKEIVIIKQGERTMMWVKLNPPIMTITADSATHSSTFTVGIIVHEACHMRLYHEGKSSDPSDYKSIQNEEMVCIDREHRIMKEIGASPQELDMIRRQDGSHFDVDGDGDYDLNDFEQMNW